ncbi:Tungstate uptake system permease protein TupB [bacterium HR40]|nr:Tungstate uptake system permease protein TupB [bacterium HR40]
MDELTTAFVGAAALILGADPALLEIVALSLLVSLSAVTIAALLGLPLGAVLAALRFPGRRVMIVAVNALMGLPPVVVGLFIYLLLSNSGPLGALGLLYTPSAMVIAQTVLVMPIVVALAHELLSSLHEEYDELFRSLGLRPAAVLATLLWEGRFGLVTVLLAGFGRAIAEVGAVMIVGGNIAHLTRVMTTAIALETAKGEIAQALALGLVLLVLAFTVNLLVALFRQAAMRLAYG